MNTEWCEYSLGELLNYEQPTPYIVKNTNYSDKYRTPVLTAGKTFILGKTSEDFGVYDALPVIIFDDFTTGSQYVNFPFKVKSSAMKILTANSELVLPKYIYYRMQAIQFDHSPHKRYWIQQYSKIKVKIPPIPEQQRIVSHIEELLSQLDDGVETLNKVRQQLAVYRLAVLIEEFASFGSKVPFGEIMSSNLGKMLDKVKNQGTPRCYIRNANVRWFSFDLSDLLEMRISDDETERYSIQQGDLVICEGGEPGRCAVWNSTGRIFFQKALHRVRFKQPCNPKFYMYYLWFAAQSGVLKHFFTGSGIKHLTGDSLKKIPVPFADISLQNTVVQGIEAKMSVCDNTEQSIITTLQQSESIRQCILMKMFEGE